MADDDTTEAEETTADSPANPPGEGFSEVPVEPDPLEVAQEEAKKYREQLLRTAADFDNFRKRSRREVTDATAQGRDDLLRDLLPVFDNLERAVAHAEKATDVQSLADGILMVMKQFGEALSRMSIERVESIGKPFDPVVHEAIQHLETDEHPPGTVAAEVQGGYLSGDRLVRPALVVVAKAPAASPAQSEGDGDGASERDAGEDEPSTSADDSSSDDESK